MGQRCSLMREKGHNLHMGLWNGKEKREGEKNRYRKRLALIGRKGGEIKPVEQGGSKRGGDDFVFVTVSDSMVLSYREEKREEASI